MSGAQCKKDPGVLTPSDSFQFACHDALPCFTQCCRDVNIYLTPYDVLRLRRALKMGSSEFLAAHTRNFLAKGVNIPVVQLDMDPQSLYCRFVTERGCQVYEDRPWACRLFPLDLASVEGEYTTIVGKDRCFGLCEHTNRTVEQWLEDQNIAPYTEMERKFQGVMPPGIKPGAGMGGGLGKLLFLAYDLDRFATLLNDPRFLKLYELDEDALREARENDEFLLELAFRYIRTQIIELSSVS